MMRNFLLADSDVLHGDWLLGSKGFPITRWKRSWSTAFVPDDGAPICTSSDCSAFAVIARDFGAIGTDSLLSALQGLSNSDGRRKGMPLT